MQRLRAFARLLRRAVRISRFGMSSGVGSGEVMRDGFCNTAFEWSLKDSVDGRCARHGLLQSRRGWCGAIGGAQVLVSLSGPVGAAKSVRLTWGAYWPDLPFRLGSSDVRTLPDYHVTERLYDSKAPSLDSFIDAGSRLSARLDRLRSRYTAARLIEELREQTSGRPYVRLSALVACLTAELGEVDRAHRALEYVKADLAGRGLADRIATYVEGQLNHNRLSRVSWRL